VPNARRKMRSASGRSAATSGRTVTSDIGPDTPPNDSGVKPAGLPSALVSCEKRGMPSGAQLRILKAIGESPFWKVTGRIHTWLYRMTGGAVGHSAGAIKNLLLTTTGRKSGELRTVPLAYLPDGDRYVIVASNGGADRHPQWWLNLRADPRATVQIGRAEVPVIAHRAEGAEWERLWPLLKAYNPFYANYEQITARQIPVVVLAPSSH